MSECLIVKGITFTEKDILTLVANCETLEAQKNFLENELATLSENIKVGDCSE